MPEDVDESACIGGKGKTKVNQRNVFLMQDGILVATIAAVGAITTGLISVLGGRTRLVRIESLSRVLKDLSPEDESYAPLAAVRLDEARELQRSQSSPSGLVVGASVLALVLMAAWSAFGDLLATTSPSWSVVLTILAGGSVLIALMIYSLVTVVYVVRGLRAASKWLKGRPSTSSRVESTGTARRDDE